MEGPNTATRKTSTVGNVLVPPGLLQNVVSDGPHQFSRRQSSQAGLRRESRQNSIAGLTTRPLYRSQTLDADDNSHADPVHGRTMSRPGLNTRHDSLAHPGASGPPVGYNRALSVVSSSNRRQRASQAVPLRPLSPILGEDTAQTDEVQHSAPAVSVPPPSYLPRGTSISFATPVAPHIGSVSIIDSSRLPGPAANRVSFVPSTGKVTERRGTDIIGPPRRKSTINRLSIAVKDAARKVVPRPRRTSVRETFEKAQERQHKLQRSKPFQILFEYAIYLLLLAFVYLVLIGRPLWGGTIWYVYILFEYHLTFIGGTAVFVGLAFFYAFGPLLVFFETPAPMLSEKSGTAGTALTSTAGWADQTSSEASFSKPKDDTALLIPCYKSAKLLPATLTAALKIFEAKSIFILANGNSPTPLDETADVCAEYGVNHVWVPVGSKIVAQYVGSYIIRSHNFLYSLLIDDDCILPPNFPIVSDRLNEKIRCLGYTLTSIGANGSRGNWCQQAQDLEYKLSGIQRLFAGKIGSATFPHGAIVLWENEFLIETFKHHPGFSVSEDWFFGHVARELGSRIIMCSSVFVETETPANCFFASRGDARGGFGEMTVFQQRFKRWNFFFVNGAFYNLAYILFSWKLGWREIGAKVFVFQEVYETFLYLITPIVLPIMFIVRPVYATYLFAGTLAMYFVNSMLFNEIQLRLVGRRVNRWMLVCYFMPYKIALTAINVASCWWSLWKYASYFARRHPRIIEDTNAVGVVLKIEEEAEEQEDLQDGTQKDFAHSEAPSIPTEPTKGPAGPADRKVSLANGSRNFVVSAVKVDIVDEVSDIFPTNPNRISAIPPDQFMIEPVESSAVSNKRFKRRSNGNRPLSLVTQLTTWRPDWVDQEGEPTNHRYLLRVEESQNEDVKSDGYSYYGT